MQTLLEGNDEKKLDRRTYAFEIVTREKQEKDQRKFYGHNKGNKKEDERLKERACVKETS